MDNCVVYDGFMAGGCATLSQDHGLNLTNPSSVVGLRLFPPIYPPPPDGEDEREDWSTVTSAIFSERESTEYESWRSYGLGWTGLVTSADNLYTIHGELYILISSSQNKPTLCVEQRIKNETAEICRYFREENEGIGWDPADIEVSVLEHCNVAFGDQKILLKYSSCYNIMRPSDCKNKYYIQYA